MPVLKCPRVDYETNDDGIPINACTGIRWRPDKNGDPEPTPDTGGTFLFHCFRDSEGDPGVINGMHYFDVAEVVSQSCVCVLSDGEMDRLYEQAIEQAKDRDYD